jgi:hypothetical protein
LEMVRSRVYREIEHLRSEALLHGELHPMVSAGASMPSAPTNRRRGS